MVDREVVKAKGENPKTRPPTKAAGVHLTHRRSSQNIAKGGSCGPEGGRDVQGGDRTEQPRDRGERDTDGEDARVREHVDAVRVEQRSRIERIVTVRDRVGGPFHEPDEERRVVAFAARDARGMSRPDVPPEEDSKTQVSGERHDRLSRPTCVSR